MGVPDADQPWLARAMELMTAGVAGQRQREPVERANTAVDEMLGYFDDLLARRASEPEDDLLSLLALDDLASRARPDLVANCIFFLLAGHATTTALLTAGAALLADHPEHLAWLQAEPTRWDSAVEELLRFVSPMTITGMCPTVEVEIAGATFPAGVNRIISFAAANRDAEVFPDPDRFDPTRDPNHHLAFSFGRHHCVGAPLARLHARVALPLLFGRLPELRFQGELTWRASVPVRQITSAIISWRGNANPSSTPSHGNMPT